jgi:hypothetical protein
MFGLRQFVRSGRSSRLLALWIAYSLAIQALTASVGLGMSAFAAPGQGDSAICSHASSDAPAPRSGQHNPNPSAPCPFCFVAAQSVGHLALMGPLPSVPAYAGLLTAPVFDQIANRGFVPQSRRTVGAPRAPPAFSV